MKALIKGVRPIFSYDNLFALQAKNSTVIDSLTAGRHCAVQNGGEIVAELCGAFILEKQNRLLKQAQRYSVNLFDYRTQEVT